MASENAQLGITFSTLDADGMVQYVLEYQNADDGAWYVVTEDFEVAPSETVITYRVTFNEVGEYKFKAELKRDGAILCVTDEISVTACKSHTVTFDVGEGGTASLISAQVADGGSISFTVTANENYKVSSVKVGEDELTDDENGVYTIENITEEKTVTVRFAPVAHAITWDVDTNGAVTAVDGNTVAENAEHGTDVQFMVVANDGYEVSSVMVGEDVLTADENGVYTIENITEEKTVTVSFALKTYTITWDVDTNGAVTAVDGNAVAENAEHGSNVQFMVVANEGYDIVSVKVGEDELTADENNVYTIENITEEKTVSVSFVLKTYTITWEISGHGVVKSADGTAIQNGYVMTVNHGGSVVFTADPAKGYGYEVTANNATLSNCEISNVTQDYTIKVTFGDREAPQISDPKVDKAEEWTNEAKCITFTVTDTAGSVTVYITKTPYHDMDLLQEQVTDIESDGEDNQYTYEASETGTYYIYAVDENNNWENSSVEVSKIDTVKPTVKGVEIKEDGKNGPFYNGVTLVVKASDADSGVDYFQYQVVWSGKEPTENGWSDCYEGQTDTDGNVTVTFNIKDSFKGQIYVRVVDEAGNSYTVNTNEISNDTTPPVIASVDLGNNVSDNIYNEVAVKITATDDYSGIVCYQYQIVAEGEELDENGWSEEFDWVTTGENFVTFEIEDSFEGRIYVRVKDGNGYYSVHKRSETIINDTTNPEIEPVDLGNNVSDNIYNNVEVKITATDVHSEIDCYQYQIVAEGEELDENGWSEEFDWVTTGENFVTFEIEDSFEGQIYIRVVDKAGNSYTVNTAEICNDTTPPVISLSYDNDDVRNGVYFNADRVATIVITEHNFVENGVVITATKDGEVYTPDFSGWTPGEEADTYIATITYSADGDYTFDIEVKDKAENANNGLDIDEDTVAPFQFTIDKTAPVISLSYDNNDVRNGVYFNADRIATIVITEHNFVESGVEIEATKDGEKYTPVINWTPGEEADTYIATIPYTTDGDYTFYIIEVEDMAENANNGLDIDEDITKAPFQFTIDKTAPVISLSYDNNDVRNGVYFNADRIATIVITEHNFVESGVEIEATKDGEKYTPVINWTPGEEADTYIATIPYTTDGDYTFYIIEVEDMAENANNGLDIDEDITKAPFQFTIDKTAPVISLSYVNNEPDEKYDTYFDAPRTATIVITEHNFSSEFVDIRVTKDGVEIEQDIEWDPNGDVYTATIAYTTDGDYEFAIDMKDMAENDGLKVLADGTKAHDKFTIDLKDPEIYLYYVNNEPDTEYDTYFDAPREAHIEITEHNFDEDRVEITVTKDGVEIEQNVEWDSEGDVHKAIIPYSTDGDYTFAIEMTDMSGRGNKGIDLAEDTVAYDKFTIDLTDPEIYLSYVNNEPDAEYDTYFDETRIATIVITEHNFVENRVVIEATKDGEMYTPVINWTPGEEADTYIATIPYSTDGDYEFEIWVKDMVSRSNEDINLADGTKAHDKFTIDLKDPIVEVVYNNNAAANGNYFNAGRVATVTITEHNFDQARVEFTFTVERGEGDPTVTWTHDEQNDTHTATITYAADGDYTFAFTMTDKAGRGNVAVNYGNSAAPDDFIIDTTYEDMITVEGIESGKAYGYEDAVIPNVDISDINLDSYTVTLVGVQKGTTIDLTDEVNQLLAADAENVKGIFDIFALVQDMDGIYTLTITSQDKAGNQDTVEITFTVNRFGSVYAYDGYLMDLIANGGAYVYDVTEDLVIMEYNADKLLSGSLVIEITCDGKPVENVIYEVTPEINDTVAVGESGWYQYRYTISKDNFTSDGVYKVSISSKDATGNTPENNGYEDLGIVFRVDSTNAEITSIVGLEEAIINATNQEVFFTVYDTMGIKSIKIYVDGELIQEISDFGDDQNNYTGSFVLDENTAAQSVRIVVEDMSGNITDTDAEDFTSAYVFNRSVTVSTNFFVRWYANKPLFWGSIIGTVAVIGGLWFFIFGKRKKKEEETAAQ